MIEEQPKIDRITNIGGHINPIGTPFNFDNGNETALVSNFDLALAVKELREPDAVKEQIRFLEEVKGTNKALPAMKQVFSYWKSKRINPDSNVGEFFKRLPDMIECLDKKDRFDLVKDMVSFYHTSHVNGDDVVKSALHLIDKIEEKDKPTLMKHIGNCIIKSYKNQEMPFDGFLLRGKYILDYYKIHSSEIAKDFAPIVIDKVGQNNLSAVAGFIFASGLPDDEWGNLGVNIEGRNIVFINKLHTRKPLVYGENFKEEKKPFAVVYKFNQSVGVNPKNEDSIPAEVIDFQRKKRNYEDQKFLRSIGVNAF